MSRVVPLRWMPGCRMERIITHWTAGSHRASTLDRERYPILFEQDGRLVRGDHSIADNENTADGDYAGHTRMVNSRAIGVAVCCMADAFESPFRPGPAPMTSNQYEVLAIV